MKVAIIGAGVLALIALAATQSKAAKTSTAPPRPQPKASLTGGSSYVIVLGSPGPLTRVCVKTSNLRFILIQIFLR